MSRKLITKKSYFGTDFQMNELGAVTDVRNKKAASRQPKKGAPHQSCQPRGSQLGMILLPRGHLATSKDICSRHYWSWEMLLALEVMLLNILLCIGQSPNKELSVLKCQGGKVEKPSVSPQSVIFGELSHPNCSKHTSCHVSYIQLINGSKQKLIISIISAPLFNITRGPVGCCITKTVSLTIPTQS